MQFFFALYFDSEYPTCSFLKTIVQNNEENDKSDNLEQVRNAVDE